MRTHARLGLAAALVAGAALAAPAVAAPSVALKAAAPSAGKSADSGPRTDKASSSRTTTKTITCYETEGNMASPVAGTITFSGADNLWPPNHKYVPVQITWTDEDNKGGPDPSKSDKFMTTWNATHDQFAEDGTELNGSGNTDGGSDIIPAMQPGDSLMGEGTQTQVFQVRAERSGTRGEGRTYTITGDTTFTDSDMDDSSEEMSTCRWSFVISVPHDQGKGAGNSGTPTTQG